MVWQVNGTPNTLSSPSDDIDITDLAGLQFNQFLLNKIVASGSPVVNITFNNDGGSNYARRTSNGGASDITLTNQTALRIDNTSALDGFGVMGFIGLSGDEKLGIIDWVNPSSPGAGSPPERFEMVGKWVNTANTIDRIDSNSAGPDYGTNSNLSALGTD